MRKNLKIWFKEKIAFFKNFDIFIVVSNVKFFYVSSSTVRKMQSFKRRKQSAACKFGSSSPTDRYCVESLIQVIDCYLHRTHHGSKYYYKYLLLKSLPENKTCKYYYCPECYRILNSILNVPTIEWNVKSVQFTKKSISIKKTSILCRFHSKSN